MFGLIGLLVVSQTAQAATYKVSGTSQDRPAVVFRVPYSSGVHEGRALAIEGAVVGDLSAPQSLKGEFKVPIASLLTGNASRDCHLREALGLDYSKSAYPREHVCGSENTLPGQGPDSIVYPEINFKLKSVVQKGPEEAELSGEWTIHGKSRLSRFMVKTRYEGDKVRIRGDLSLSLRDFDIQVKPAKILFLTIKVDDKVDVALDLVVLK